MATAFDYTNIALLSLLSYAREAFGEELTLEELADAIENDASEFFAENASDEQDQSLTSFAAEAQANMLRKLAENGYTYDDLLNGVTNVLPEEALNEITGEADEEEEDDEDSDEELDDESDEDDEDEDSDEEEEDDEDEDDEDLEEEEDEDEEEEEDDEEEDLDEDDY